MSKSEKIESETAIFYFENDILHITFKQDADVKLDQVKENIKIRKEMQQGKKALVLGDIRGVWQISSEARSAISAKQVTDLNIAMAIITGSLTTRMLANFFIRFNKPQSPTKLFSSREKALEWLETFR